jgi:tetratricopeptide (TPR) repeat protein
MGDTFDSKGGEQNIAQGDHATGKQENVTQELRGDGNISSGTGNVTVNQVLPLKPRTAVIAAVLAAGLLGTGFAGWHWFAPPTQSISTKGNQAPAIHAGGNVAVTYGMSSEEAVKLARELVGPLQGELAAKNKQIKALTEAITALTKADAPAKSINAALQELEKGNTAQAQAIFAEVLRSKEAEGQKANKEAAAAARHLGALAFKDDTKGALAAYQKAVVLDPDNAEGWIWLGILLEHTGELAQAEEAYRKVLALAEAHQNQEEQAWAVGNLGLVYKIRGELDKAEEMHRKALALDEALGRKEGMANQYGNLGNVYQTRGDLAQAEEMYNKSLEISEALNLKETTASIYGNLGEVYRTRGDLAQAEEMYRKALALDEALGRKEGMAINYGNLGIVYKTRGDLAQAEEMHRKALALNEALGRKEGMAINYGNLGIVYEKRGNLAQAEELWKKSLRLYQAMQHPNAKKVQQWLDELAQQRSSSH